MSELFMYVDSCDALSAQFFAVDGALNSSYYKTKRMSRNLTQ